MGGASWPRGVVDARHSAAGWGGGMGAPQAQEGLMATTDGGVGEQFECGGPMALWPHASGGGLAGGGGV